MKKLQLLKGVAKMLKLLSATLFVILVLLATPYITASQGSSFARYQDYVSSVQLVLTESGNQGTSWMVDIGPNKFISALHVFIGNSPSARNVILGPKSDRNYKINILYFEPKYDLVLFEIESEEEYQHFLRTNGNPKPLQIAPIGSTNEGDPVRLIGSPLEQYFSYWSGYVAKTRFIKPPNEEIPLGELAIYTIIDARIGPGLSGGPVLDVNGQVIGVVQSTISRGETSPAYGHAVSNDIIWKFLNEWKYDLNTDCEIFFGISLQDFKSMQTEWLTISDIEPGGIFSEYLKPGDTEITIRNIWSNEAGEYNTEYSNGITWKRIEDAVLSQRTLYCGETLNVRLLRDGNYIDIEIEVPMD